MMKPGNSRHRLLVLAALLVAGATAPARGVTTGMLRSVGFDQNLDAQVPLDVPLRDEAGRTVRLGDYFGEKPVILTLNYYECPMLCTVELNGLVQALRTLSFEVGKEFAIVTVSINPSETPKLAAAKKRLYLRRLGQPGAEAGWHFLTGEKASIDRIARAVGFRYVYDPESGQYAHAAGLVVLTPRGKVARYFYGIEYSPRDLRYGLIEASANRIGSPVEQLLLTCFHYDPRTGKYNLVVLNLLRVFGVATVAALGTFMLVMFGRDRRRAKAGTPDAAGPVDDLPRETR